MDQKQNIEQFKGQPRLPKFAVPKRYDLHLKLDLSACTFSGLVDINLCILEPTKFIVLNACELAVHQVFFTNSLNHKFTPCDVVLVNDDELLVLVFDEMLGTGEGMLRIEFTGALNEHLKGLYKCTYVDDGIRKNMAVTQFEPVCARRCFPCWDEPALKATFKITLDLPSELIALSNMPINDEKINGNVKTVYFEESPVMSTYLVAITVGLFDHIEETTSDGIKVGVYCPVGKSDEGKFALEVAVKSLDVYTRYFSMPYPLPKLDMVAVPEFSGGAMENYGLIIYRENEMLYNDLRTAAARKQIITIVVAHEVAHQWFGNLVTMEWWTHLWLNEGFATWISYMAADIMFPEWKIWSQFLQQTNGGLRMDAQEQSHPIEVEIQHAHSVDEIFDAISYKKGSAVIKMLQGYLGDEIFQKSLSLYMKRYAWSNAKTEDLWSVLSEVSGIQVNSMMDSWTKQKGYPVISVKSKEQILELEQSQFLSSGFHGDGQWTVPITLCLGSYDRCKSFLLDSKSEVLDISELFPSPAEKNEDEYGKASWIKVNVEQGGFYRVKYGDELGARLRKAIQKDCLSATDRYGILDDTYALCVACEQSLSSLLSLMDVYRNEIDYIVLSKLIDVCYNVLEVLKDAIPNLVNAMKEFFINLLLFSAEKLGWESAPGESHLNALMRAEVFMALAAFDHGRTHEEAMQCFQTLLNDKNTPLLSADTKRAAYIAVMRNANATSRDGFESLLKIYREADAVQEKERILRTIASTPDPDILVEVLNFLISDEVRDQDITYGVAGISLEGRNMAWRWLKENWNFIVDKYGSGFLITHFIGGIITPFCSHEKADEIEEFFVSRMRPTFAMNLKQSIEQVRIKARWVESLKQEQQSLQDLLKQLAH
ncbi:Peptidase M1, alanine aminopeptidase/leukotriene A4 hydrolase [Corchorus capsularis]|uniref:Aminopeptidase n=1 Tax=Corchorus capsularis TaxID=210143 RepID=A0A1R3HK68_COCAP|nr:Peptidase M1, alanine aminopeptidase/leukotriene A4 hydrolase [Corchorus capsularis]